jgi:hypothetical protein
MKAGGVRFDRPWIWASLAGVVALVALTFLIRVPKPIESLPRETPPSVGLVDPVVIMGTMLRDPTPLFLPTEFNSSRRNYVPSEPGGAFAAFPPILTFDPSELVLDLPSPLAVPASPAEALRGEPPGATFIGFDRADPLLEPLSPRGAYVEITEAGTGRSVLGKSLADAHPPATSVPWQPMEFMAAVDVSGLVGPVVPTTRSGVAEVDAYFGRYLAETLRVGQRFAPGFYRISVGP